MGRLIPAEIGMEFYRRFAWITIRRCATCPPRKWTKRRSSIEQRVAAASARPVAEPEPDPDDTDLEELGIGLEDEGTFDVA